MAEDWPEPLPKKLKARWGIDMGVTIKRKNASFVSDLLKRYASKKVIAVGYPVGEEGTGLKYPNGKEVLDVAVYNNFGTETIPRRDFFTPGGANAVEAVKPVYRQQVKKLNRGETSVETILETAGPFAQAQMQLAIRDLSEPENAPSTIAEKGSNNPLVDDGLLQQAMSHVVRDK